MVIDSRIEMKYNTGISGILTSIMEGKHSYTLYCDNPEQAKEVRKLFKKEKYKCGFIFSDPSYWNKESCYFKIKWKKVHI